MNEPMTYQAEGHLLRPARQAVERAQSELAKTNDELLEAIRDARRKGMTLQAIGDAVGLSKQRVKQLLDRP